MRTFDEISADIRSAANTNNAEALLRYANELDAFGMPQAEAIACDARGWASYLTSDYTQALEYYLRALALYEELGDRKGVARAHGNIGNIHSMTGDSSATLESYRSALALFEELGDRSGVAHVTCNIGNLYSNVGDYPAAVEHYHRALALHEELGDRSGVASVTGNIGIIHERTGDYAAALEHFLRALALREALGDREGVASVTNNIGISHLHTGDFTLSLEYFHRALALHEALGDRRGVAIATGNIGNVHRKTGDYPAALEHYYRALALHEELGYRSGVAHVTNSIVASYLALGSNAKAQELLQAMDTLQIDEPDVRINRELHRAALQRRSGDLDSAAETLQRALTEAETHGLRSQTADAHKALRDLAQERDDLAAYIEHNNEYTRIIEEINGKETATKLAMQAKQREIEAERKETEKQLAVLHAALPKHIADRVARGEAVNDHFDDAAVLFLDVVSFTTHSAELDPSTVVELLQQMFTEFDAICGGYNVMKIKTIGDSYMAVAFPSEHHLLNIANVALKIQLHEYRWPQSGERVGFRFGLHCGPLIAGVIGTERLQYDVWGDTVNVASRMESSGEPGRIQVTEAFASALQSVDSGLWTVDSHNDSVKNDSMTLFKRGTIEVKGKGPMTTYWLEGTV